MAEVGKYGAGKSAEMLRIGAFVAHRRKPETRMNTRAQQFLTV